MSDIVSALRCSPARFDSRSRERIDARPGLYAFWLRGICLYVGMSEDLRRRIYEHATSEDNPKLAYHFETYPYDIEISIAYKNVDSATLHQLELQAISILRPIDNIQGSIQ